MNKVPQWTVNLVKVWEKHESWWPQDGAVLGKPVWSSLFLFVFNTWNVSTNGNYIRINKYWELIDVRHLSNNTAITTFLFFTDLVKPSLTSTLIFYNFQVMMGCAISILKSTTHFSIMWKGIVYKNLGSYMIH